MIPHEKSAAVARGLQAAFGVTELEDIHILPRGLTSALVYRIVLRGSPFALRMMMRSGDATRQFTCMRAAAEAGLAPRAWYTSVEDRLSITDFVDSEPFRIEDARTLIGEALRRLHALAPFPGTAPHLNTSCTLLLHNGPAVEGFIRSFQDSNALPKSEGDELLALGAQLAGVCARSEPDLVSSHNDLKPDNILFDGKRVWLVDWEAASLNDRYSDLAVMTNFVITNEVEERCYLEEYFGKLADEYQQARFYLTLQLVHVFYAIAYLWLGSSGEPVNQSDSAPDFREFHQRIWEGEVNLGDKQMKPQYGRVHLQRLLQNVQQPRYREALRMACQSC